MAQITNVVTYAELNCMFDLNTLARRLHNVVYNPHKFHGLIWKHRHICGSCLIFNKGKLVGNGTSSWTEAKHSVRQYVRLLQKMGHPVQLKRIHLTTMSAVYTLANKVNYYKLLEYPGTSYEPELFHALMLKKNCINFIIFQSGKVVITGIKEELNVTVNPILMELELLI